MPTDHDLAQLVKVGRLQEALTLLQDQRRNGARPRREPLHELLDDLGELKRAGASLTAVVGLFAKQMVVLGVLILVLTAVGLGVAKWTLFPAMDWLFALVIRLMFNPGVLPVLAPAVFVCGLVVARRVRSPFMFMAGITGVSLGLICFWLFPFYIRLLQQRVPAEAELPLLIVGGVISLLIFVCGIQLAAQANH